MVLWIVASALFALYVANFSSYNKTYGSLGGVIVFLTWLWITNIIILLGAEFNSEMERSKAIQEGHPPDKEPYLPLRDEPKPQTSACARSAGPSARGPCGRAGRTRRSSGCCGCLALQQLGSGVGARRAPRRAVR